MIKTIQYTDKKQTLTGYFSVEVDEKGNVTDYLMPKGMAEIDDTTAEKIADSILMPVSKKVK